MNLDSVCCCFKCKFFFKKAQQKQILIPLNCSKWCCWSLERLPFIKQWWGVSTQATWSLLNRRCGRCGKDKWHLLYQGKAFWWTLLQFKVAGYISLWSCRYEDFHEDKHRWLFISSSFSLQAQLSFMRYISVCCVIGIIAGFCIGPGKLLSTRCFVEFSRMTCLRWLEMGDFLSSDLWLRIKR